MKISFSGGIHPSDSKEYNRDASLEYLPLPEKLIISLSQGFGAPSVFVKEIGAKVKRGEKLADPSGPMGNFIYSPCSGEITELIDITLPSSVKTKAVVIKPDEPGTVPSKDDYEKLPDNDNNIEMIKAAGIVGLGGAGFPTHLKFSIPEGKKIDYFIVNAAECEPFLCADYRLLKERSEESVRGVIEAAKALGVKEAFIAIEDNKKDTVELVNEAISKIGSSDVNVTVKELKTKYPQGDEKNLIKAITKREVPSGKLPLDAGCVVSNLGTCYAIYEAVVNKKPLIERVVSVTGDAINKPKNVIAPLGALVSDLINFSEGFEEEPEKMISGGPMMGFAFFDLNTPVTKTTSGITFLKEAYVAKPSPCISCGRCVRACPMHLVPTRLFKLIANAKYKEAMDENLMDCRECGCCEFECPANISLVQGFKFGKKMGRIKK